MTEFPPLIQAMLDPAFYPHGPKEVELIQTHISYIFLVVNTASDSEDEWFVIEKITR